MSTSKFQKPIPGKISLDRFTPSSIKAGQKPKTSGFAPRRGTSSSGSDSTSPVSPGASAEDRMAQFREAQEKEKAREERKKQQAEEKKRKEEERKKQEEEKKLQEGGDEEEEEEKEGRRDSTAPCQKKNRVKQKAQRTMSISSIVLEWAQEMTKDYPNVEIKNFSTSWSSGLAFCALIHRFNPDEFDFSELKPENRRDNLELAFNTGQKVKQIPMLLDAKDILRMKRPEPRSVQTYVQWIWSVYGAASGYGPTPQEIQSAALE